MTRAESHPHHPHLPYREWGGGGAGENALVNDNNINPVRRDCQAGKLVRWAKANVRAFLYRLRCGGTALAERSGFTLQLRSQEFGPSGLLQRRYRLFGGHVVVVSRQRAVRHPHASIDMWESRPPTERHRNGVRRERERVTTYRGLTQ